MKIYDIAVVGSGMGGALFASQHKNSDIIVFEKDSNLGGCAQTFKHKGCYFNAGATTFAGYEDNHIVKELFEKAKVKPNIKQMDIAFRVIQNQNQIDRTSDFETFLQNIEKIYPNKNNRKFWTTLKNIDTQFWNIKDIYFSKHSFKHYIGSLQTGNKLFFTFGFDLFKSANSFIKATLGDISQEYRDFLEATLMITVQQKSHNLPLVFFALGLSYPFHPLHYPAGGMGTIIEELLEGVNVHPNEAVVHIEKSGAFYKLETKKDIYFAKSVVLNGTLFDSSALFRDKKIKQYYDSFKFFDQSAFMFYCKLKTQKKLLHHYQIILKKNIPNCVSNSFFISISDSDDLKMSNDGLSVTISTHTKVSFWKNLSKSEYQKEKEKTLLFIKQSFLEHLEIEENEIEFYFGATPNTYNRYINRYNCGGVSSSFGNILYNSGVVSPFKNLYQIGDTTLGAQGWPGVALGVGILQKAIKNG